MSHVDAADETSGRAGNDPSPGTQKVLLGVGWALVGLPLVYGLVQTLRRVVTLFSG